MATLLNTLLATLFPALLAPQDEAPVTTETETTVEIVTVSQEETKIDGFQVYFYPRSDTSCHS